MKHRLLLFIPVLCLLMSGILVPTAKAAQQRGVSPPIDNTDAEEYTPPESMPEADQPTPPTNYEDIPDEYLDEAQRFGEYCKKEINLRQWHDCECLAVKYLDHRIKVGPEAHSSVIMLAIEEQCPDATEAAGVRYQQCIGDALLMPENIPIEQFCTCYANTFARLFEAGQYEPGSGTSIKLQVKARLECEDQNHPSYR